MKRLENAGEGGFTLISVLWILALSGLAIGIGTSSIARLFREIRQREHILESNLQHQRIRALCATITDAMDSHPLSIAAFTVDFPPGSERPSAAQDQQLPAAALATLQLRTDHALRVSAAAAPSASKARVIPIVYRTVPLAEYETFLAIYVDGIAEATLTSRVKTGDATEGDISLIPSLLPGALTSSTTVPLYLIPITGLAIFRYDGSAIRLLQYRGFQLTENQPLIDESPAIAFSIGGGAASTALSIEIRRSDPQESGRICSAAAALPRMSHFELIAGLS